MAAAIKRVLFGKVHLPASLADKLDKSHVERRHAGFDQATSNLALFPKTDPAIDGEACLRDCEGCTANLPAKWRIDEDQVLYGQLKGWERHLVVATGKSDWVRDVSDEKGSVMESIREHNSMINHGVRNLPFPPLPLNGQSSLQYIHRN